MACPFYAHSIHTVPNGPDAGMSLLFPNPGSNQCALITSAHSPCLMEVVLKSKPEWVQCPRNPECLYSNPYIPPPV